MYAILITGRVNAWEYCLKSLRTYLLDRLTEPILIFLSASGDPTDPYIKALVEELQPTAWSAEFYTPPDLDEHPIYKHHHAMHINPSAIVRYASAFYHNYNAWEMMEAYLGAHPEVGPLTAVLKVRIDVKFLSPFELPEVYEPSVLYMPPPLIGTAGSWPGNWIPDHIAAGTPETMQAYCSLHLHRHERDHFCPEYTLFTHLDPLGITWRATSGVYKLTGKRLARPDMTYHDSRHQMINHVRDIVAHDASDEPEIDITAICQPENARWISLSNTLS